METFLIILHIFVVLGLTAVILLQPSESEGFGIGTGGFSFSKLATTKNPLTVLVAFLATLFFITSLGFSLLKRYTNTSGDFLNRIESENIVKPKISSKEGLLKDLEENSVPSSPEKIEKPLNNENNKSIPKQ